MKPFKRFLSEMPQLISPTNFGLRSPIKNNKEAKKILETKPDEIIRQTDDYILLRNGTDKKGYIVLINKHDTTIEYYVDYEFSYTKQLPGVTQIKLWRHRMGQFNHGITKDIFFNYLLKKHNTIISDRQQTKSGQDFWLARMAEAANQRLHVGLYHEVLKEMNWFEPSLGSYKKWVDDNYGWGEEPGYADLRYLISTKRKYNE